MLDNFYLRKIDNYIKAAEHKFGLNMTTRQTAEQAQPPKTSPMPVKKPIPKVPTPKYTPPPMPTNPPAFSTWNKPKPGQLQTSKQSISPIQQGNERLPKLYDSAQRLTPDAHRILSFGCSTGEEAQALGRRFRDAEIVGVDIDKWAIDEARRKNNNDRIYFTDCLEPTGKYDLILACSVLFRISPPLPQEDWLSAVKKLDKHCRDGGIIMVFNSSYNPMEALGDKYTEVNAWTHEHTKSKQQMFNGYYRKQNSIWVAIKQKAREILESD